MQSPEAGLGLQLLHMIRDGMYSQVLEMGSSDLLQRNMFYPQVGFKSLVWQDDNVLEMVQEFGFQDIQTEYCVLDQETIYCRIVFGNGSLILKLEEKQWRYHNICFKSGQWFKTFDLAKQHFALRPEPAAQEDKEYWDMYTREQQVSKKRSMEDTREEEDVDYWDRY